MESERNLMNTTEAARYLGVKPSYQDDDAPRSPLLQAGRQTVLLREGRPRCLAETGKGKVAGRNRQRGHGLSREPGEKQMIYPLYKTKAV